MNHELYQEALDYLYQFINYSLERSFRYAPETFDLGRVHRLLALLGNPQDRFESVHIAGTKGKGSTAALVESALRAAGYRTGLYTSPHLLRFTERVQVGGAQIPEQGVVRLVERLKGPVSQVADLTTYELITALGFLYFAEQEVELAVVEVGLGGRLDATNVLAPLVSVITSISYDHMHLLGETLPEIAAEKAGIIKPGVPVVVAPQQREAERVVREVAATRGAPLVEVGKDWLFAQGSRSLQGQAMYVWSAEEQPLVDAYIASCGDQEWAPLRLNIPLLGYHQVVNAAVAYATLHELRERGVTIGLDAIRDGFREVHWPGRFQVLSTSPTVVVDAAHNRDSALKLRIALDDYFPGRPVALVFGASTDKDIAGMVAELAPRVRRVFVTQAVHPRAAEPGELTELARKYGLPVEEIVPVTGALARAVASAVPDEVILVTGSLFVAGEAVAAWQEMAAAGLQLEGRREA